MALPRQYLLADKAIASLTKLTVRKAAEVKRKLTVLKFDELNVMKEVDALYKWIANANLKKIKELYFTRYLDVLLALTGRKWISLEEEDEIDELVEQRISGLLSTPSDVTHYTYDSELERKRDRAKEAILSVPTSAQKQIEIDKHVKYILQQTAFYVDLAEDDATIQAFKACGVKRVRWHTQEDEKVCVDCEEKDGVVYPIDDIPTKPHPRCRCYLTPVK